MNEKEGEEFSVEIGENDERLQWQKVKSEYSKHSCKVTRMYLRNTKPLC